MVCENCGDSYELLNTHNSPIGRICTDCFDVNKQPDWGGRLYSADEIDRMEWTTTEDSNGVITARGNLPS